MARLRLNNIGDPTGVTNPVSIAASGGAISWLTNPGFNTLVAPNVYPITLDEGLPNEEIVYLTTYTSPNTTGTVLRAQEGTSMSAHSHGWVHAPTAIDYGTTEIVVAASNSPTSYQALANLVCTGTNDQAIINAAIVLAYFSGVGGKIVLVAGTYNLSNSCVFGNGSGTQYNNIKIVGQGKATIVSAAYALQTVAGPFTNQTVTNTSRTVNLTSATGVFIGQLVTDTGGLIPVNTVVENISGTTLTLSNAATGTSSTDQLTFQSYGVYPIFDVYDQSSSGTNPVNGCSFSDMTLTTPTPNTVSAVNITGLPGGSRNQASRSLACGVYLSGSDHTVRDLKCTNFQIGVVTDIWNRFSTIQTTDTAASVTINLATVTSSVLAPLAQIGDTLTVGGQTGGQNTAVVGYITEINLGTNVMTLDVNMLTTVTGTATVVLTPSAYGLGRAARNWIENLDCYNIWAGAVGNWTEQNHIEGVKGLFVESVMADNVGSGYTYGSVSPSVALYYDGQNGNNHLSLDMTDIEMTNMWYSGSTGSSVTGTALTGTGFQGTGSKMNMTGWFVFAEVGTGVIVPYTTVLSVNSPTSITLSQPASTNGSITTLILSQGDYRGHTIKAGGMLRANIARVRSYGNPLFVGSNACRYVQFSDLSCLSGLTFIWELPDPQQSGALNAFFRECTFTNISMDYDQSNPGGDTSSLTGVNCVYRDIVVTTNWQTASSNLPLFFQGQNNTIDGLLINHRGAAGPGPEFFTNLGGNTVRNIRGINVTNLMAGSSAGTNTVVNNVSYDPLETTLAASPTSPFASVTSASAAVIPWSYNIAPTQTTVSQSGGGTKTPDFTSCTTYVLDVTDGTAFTIGQPYPLPTLTTALLPLGMRIRVMVKNASGGAMGAITWNGAFVFTTPWINPANGQYCSVDFESDGSNWIQVGSEGLLDQALLTAPLTEKNAAGVTTAVLGWTFDPLYAQLTWQPGAGFVYLTRVKCLVSGTCGHLDYFVSVAGVTLTSAECFIGLYDSGQITSGTATLIGASADQSSIWTTAGEQHTAITAQGGHSLALVAGQDYFVGILDNGTTAPKFLCGFNGSSLGSGGATLINLDAQGSVPFRVCEDTAGSKTTFPTSIVHTSLGVGGLAALAAVLTT